MMKLIHQLSKETNIPIGTIRFYEKTGLICGEKRQEVTTNNYVYYSEEVIEKLKFIQDAKSVGFTLAEIKEVIDAWFANFLSKEKKIVIFDEKLKQINNKINDLKKVRSLINHCKIKVGNNEL